MRAWMMLVEDYATYSPQTRHDVAPAMQPKGMAAVKAVLRRRLEEPLADDTLRELWGIMDELWITPNGGLMLFRDLRLRQPWEKHLRRKGHTYWSTSSGGASAYNAGDLRGTVDVRIVAELPSRARVNWDDIWETILEFSERGEDELRLYAGIPLIVRRISVDGVDVQSAWIGKALIT